MMDYVAELSPSTTTVGISSNALFGNLANNFLNRNLSLDAEHISTFDLLC